eukprot:gnl/Dysnectes_brevis/2044_a2361_2149.p1 GENE.gnl/Dysnectes_brevis/2044_a2361_2149~~gnl/Dysnectes_brevis/2044_a2361_2149.p1  ORF type:complete len:261 (-),score=109.23 gnl/Dysnectes_brevis/2044_a2361_2149:92-874(-)
MSDKQRLANVLPTRMQLQGLKSKLASAQKGHSLLKKKVDALNATYHRYQRRIVEAKAKMQELIKDAHWSLTHAIHTTGDVSAVVLQTVDGDAPFQISRRIENVAGVRLPSFVPTAGDSRLNLAGLHGGAAQIRKAEVAWRTATEHIVDLASMQASYLALREVIILTSRRVNALEYVMIPRIKNTIEFINMELEEEAREEFSRLKKVQAKKERDLLLKEEEERKRAEALALMGIVVEGGEAARTIAAPTALEGEDALFDDL